MKQRRTIVIVGLAAITLVMAVVGLAVYFLHTIEKERNREKTAPARAKRHAEKNEDAGFKGYEPPQQQQTNTDEQSDNDITAPRMAAS